MADETTTTRVVKTTEEILETPVEAETREGRVRLPSVKDRIELENHEAAKAAANRAPFGMKTGVCVPGSQYYG